MFDFINRFVHSEDPSTITSLDRILGGTGWLDRLDAGLPRGLAVEKLFRDTLKSVGSFDFVVSTKIDKSTAERPHFFIVYGTKSSEGLKAFRETEYAALRGHAKNRANAKERQRAVKSSTEDLFAGHHAEIQEATIDEIVVEQAEMASSELIELLTPYGVPFSIIVVTLLQAYMLRETNVKDICVALARSGKIENSWGGGNRKPRDPDLIRLKEPT